MNYLSISVLLALTVSASCLSLFSLVMDDEWEIFKIRHGKKYDSHVEENFRRKIFAHNKEKILAHNKEYLNGRKTYGVKMNEFGDLFHHEFKAIMNGFRGNLTHLRNYRDQYAATFILPNEDILFPTAVDWRQKGAVTPVKNQGQCGSCWAFSSTGSLEGQHFRKTGKLISLSEQNLVDCSRSFGNEGCNGGLMDYAFQYVKKNGGIDTEKSYPYEAEDDQCQFDPNTVGADDVGYVDVRQGSEEALKKAIATVGPVSVAIDASHSSFQFYSEGVYYEPDCSSEELDHGVLAVGYGSEETDNSDYWIVKNSWGESWGQNGYVHMARNRDNNCGIASSASYPLV